MADAVVYGGVAWLSGVVAAHQEFDGFEAEVRAVLANADDRLARAGASRSMLLHVTVHVADISLMPRFNAVWETWLIGAHRPARVAVQTPMVDQRFSVAVSCVAAVANAPVDDA
jgi:enamine deaminase RidA (YjgF/YER057c/UK114 family)